MTRGVRYFFYGTLMDRELLSHVLGRRIGARDLAAARLFGWRRSAVHCKPYPIVLRRRGASVRGFVVARIRAEDSALLSAYEGDGYMIATGVAESGGRRRTVRFFAARPGAYAASNRMWRFAAWWLGGRIAGA